MPARRRRTGLDFLLCAVLVASVVLLVGLSASPAGATVAAPAWSILSVAGPTNFVPGDESGTESYTVNVTNVGGRATDGTPVTITDTLPLGVKLLETQSNATRDYKTHEPLECIEETQKAECTYTGVVPSGDVLGVKILVSVESSATGALTNTVHVAGGGAAVASSETKNQVSVTPAAFGINAFDFGVSGVDGTPDVEAGGHPFSVSTTLDLNTEQVLPYDPEFYVGAENPKDIVVDLPLGLVGNPQAAPKCPVDELEETGQAFNVYRCPANTKIGDVTVRSALGDGIASSIAGENSQVAVSPLYNLVPEHGHAAEFGFDVGTAVRAHLYASVVRTSAGYVLRVTSPDIAAEFLYPGAHGFLAGVTLTLYGDPGSRDGGGSPPAPFFANPTDCSASDLAATVHLDTWTRKGHMNADGTPDFSDPNWLSASASLPPVTGCDALRFNPTFSAQPTTTKANTPTGLAVDLGIPQAPSNDAVRATPELKNVSVRLPAGMVVSPSGANGLQACSPTQIGLEDNSQPTCPDASKVGAVEVTTPLLANPLGGSVYLAQQNNNPFGSLIALYMVVDDPVTGVLIKLPGLVSLDSATGQVTATFDNNPQLPFSDLKVHLKDGPRAPLVTPAACGTYEPKSTLTPWSGTPDATPSDTFAVSSGCARSFAPSFTAGTTMNQAGAYSPFSLALIRTDEDEYLSGLTVTLPPGLLAKLAGVPLCTDAQANEGACPDASQIGTTTVGAGPGPNPVYVQGKIYLTGPYSGGPFGVSVEVPAIAGPFNLDENGKPVIVRGSIHVNPTTAQASVVTDSLPTILQGIPLQVKTVGVTLDRPGFAFNPTNCEPLTINGTATSTQNTHATVSSRFQAANCAALAFKPKFSALTNAKTSKSGGAYLHVRVVAGSGQANIGKVRVDLPRQLPSRLGTLQKACTAAVFEANPARCPEGSLVGSAIAVTPILNEPLAGPAYLVSHGGAAFPDLDIVLQGEGITLLLTGNTNIKKGITSSTFNTVPDAPVSSFELTLPQGPYSALAANGNLCQTKLVMPTQFVAQNGMVLKQNTHIEVEGCSNTLSIPHHSIKGRNLVLGVLVPAAGKLKASGSGFSPASKTSTGREELKLTLHATKRGKFSIQDQAHLQPLKRQEANQEPLGAHLVQPSRVPRPT